MNITQEQALELLVAKWKTAGQEIAATINEKSKEIHKLWYAWRQRILTHPDVRARLVKVEKMANEVVGHKCKWTYNDTLSSFGTVPEVPYVLADISKHQKHIHVNVTHLVYQLDHPAYTQGSNFHTSTTVHIPVTAELKATAKLWASLTKEYNDAVTQQNKHYALQEKLSTQALQFVLSLRAPEQLVELNTQMSSWIKTELQP